MRLKSLIFSVLLLAASIYIFADDEDKTKKEDLDKKAKELLEQFKKDISKAKTDEDVVDSIKTLAQIKHPLILKELIKYLSKRGDSVREVAAERIANYTKDKDAASAIIDHITMQKSVELKKKFLIFVGRIKYRPLAKRLIDYFDNDETTIAQAAIESAGKLRSKDVIDPLIKIIRNAETAQVYPGGAGGRGAGMGGARGGGGARGRGAGGGGGVVVQAVTQKWSTLSAAAQAALIEITGEQKQSAKEWEEWWKKEKNSFKERPFDEEKNGEKQEK